MQRFDNVPINIAHETSEGFISDSPVVGRVGVMKYLNADGTTYHYEYRPPEEAFNADSLESLKGKPITIGHNGWVTSGNIKKMKPVGTVLSSGKQDGETIKADIVLYELPTADRELSCGYTVELEKKAGITPQGEHYDAIQRNIRYNHLAIVPKGRAGIARLNMDGSQEMEVDDMAETKIKIDGVEYAVSEEVKSVVDKLHNELAEQKKHMDELQAKYDTAIADTEKVKAEHAAAEKAQAEKFGAAVKERVDMLEVAKAHKVENADTLSNMEIKMAVVKTVHGDTLDLEGKSDEYINACFDLAKAAEKKHDDALARQRAAINADGEQETKIISSAEKLQELVEAEANMYKVNNQD